MNTKSATTKSGEIDIYDFIRALRNAWSIIIGLAFIFGIITAGYFYIKQPKYESKALVWVHQDNTAGESADTMIAKMLNRPDINRQMINYTTLIQSYSVKSKVEESGLVDGKNWLSVSAVNNSEMFYVTVYSEDASSAQKANELLLAEFQNRVQDLYKINSIIVPQITIIDAPSMNAVPIPTKSYLWIFVAIVLGALVGCLLAVGRMVIRMA